MKKPSLQIESRRRCLILARLFGVFPAVVVVGGGEGRPDHQDHHQDHQDGGGDGFDLVHPVLFVRQCDDDLDGY